MDTFKGVPRVLSGLVLCLFLLGARGCTSPETHYTWTQGGVPKIWLESADEAFCYLTRVSGNFRGAGEMVHVGLDQDPSGKVRWVLEGESRSDHVTASASCTFWSNYNLPNHVLTTPPWVTAEVKCEQRTTQEPKLCCGSTGAPWLGYEPITSPGTPTTPGTFGQCSSGPVVCGTQLVTRQYCQKPPGVATVANGPAVCYLSGLRGQFSGAGESVVIASPNRVSGDPWTLTSSSATEEETVSATSACITYQPPAVPDPQLSNAYRWGQGQPPVDMLPSDAGVCFLTAIGGNFRGDGEWVQIQRSEEGSAPQRLTGGSKQDGVWAEARCLAYKP